MKSLINNFVFSVKTECSGCIENISDVALSLGITVKIEHVVELIDMFFGKDRIFCDNILHVDGLLFLFDEFLLVYEHLSNYSRYL